MLLFTLIVMSFIMFLIKVRDIMFNCAVLEQKRTNEEIFSLIEKDNGYKREDYNKYNFQKLSIKSEDGFKLTGYYLSSNNKNKNIIIIIHGYSVDHHRSCQYVDFLKREGFDILLVDQRGHGESEGIYTTYGFYEVKDLDLWVNLMKEKLGYDCNIGIHGHSMGAATALLYANKGEGKIKFIIEEAGYSNTDELLKNTLKRCRIPIIPFYKLVCSKIKSKCGIEIRDIMPIDVVKNSTIPILFIHGERDGIVPCSMCRDMYNAKKQNKLIYIVKDGMHNSCYGKDIKRYEDMVSKFIKENI